MTNYPWYELVEENSLLQGDFLDKCPIIAPHGLYAPSYGEVQEVETITTEYDVVVMSQSCDIEHGRVDLVLVCPLWSLEEVAKQNHEFKSPKMKEKLRMGYFPDYHLLNKCDLKGMERDYRVADFRSVCSIPLGFLKDFAGSTVRRIRLLPPYREHLSQAFARFFMRVGLPADIPPFR